MLNASRLLYLLGSGRNPTIAVPDQRPQNVQGSEKEHSSKPEIRKGKKRKVLNGYEQQQPPDQESQAENPIHSAAPLRQLRAPNRSGQNQQRDSQCCPFLQ